MTFAIWAFRIILILLIIRFLLNLFSRRPIAAGRQRSQTAPERIGGTLVRDPHCGTYVPQTNAIAVRRGASSIYFCSAGCRDAWTSGKRA